MKKSPAFSWLCVVSPRPFRQSWILVWIIASCLALTAQAATLATGTTANNGWGGVFLNLTPVAETLEFTGFSTQFSLDAGTPVSVEVWTRPGSYTGFTGSDSGWTLWETVIGTSSGPITDSGLFSLTTPILLTSGQTTAVYLQTTTPGGGIRYNGTISIPPTTTTFSNSDLVAFSDTSRAFTSVAFGGSQFTNRTFVGTINYVAVVPEPGTLPLLFTALVGFGWLAVRRKRLAT